MDRYSRARMPSLGTGSIDIRGIISSIVSIVKSSRANQIYTATCDGHVLRMHYRWTFFIMLGGFLTVWYQWYHREVITCVSHFNADNQVRLDYINICLSYPFVKLPDGRRRYLTFYRWISWSLLLLAGLYYIPRKMSKTVENIAANKFIEVLADNARRYNSTEQELVDRHSRDRAAHYMIFNMKTHNGLYYKYLTVNIVALFVDIFTIHYLDFLLQGRFIQYGFKSYPIYRDPENFRDYMSQTFPPFASCELSIENQLVSRRTERFGCHLPIMELYEKIFLCIWIWLIILTTITCTYIMFLFFMWFPCIQIYILRVAKPYCPEEKVTPVTEIIRKVCDNCKIGDIYLLYRLKQHLSHTKFYDLMTRLSNPEYVKSVLQHPQIITDSKDKLPSGKQLPDNSLRNRYIHRAPSSTTAATTASNQINSLLSQRQGQFSYN